MSALGKTRGTDPHALSPIARPLMHGVHAFLFLLLLGTGLLLFVPELRTLATGGYSLLIRDVHRWGGLASVVLPAAILFRFGPGALVAVPAERSPRSLFKRAHVALSVGLTLIFTATGIVLWKAPFHEPLGDPSRELHDWLTYVAAFFFAAHLAEVAITATITRMTAPDGNRPRDPQP